jgi:hypothetical protein
MPELWGVVAFGLAIGGKSRNSGLTPKGALASAVRASAPDLDGVMCRGQNRSGVTSRPERFA